MRWNTELVEEYRFLLQNSLAASRDIKINDILNLNSNFPDVNPFYDGNPYLRHANVPFDYSELEKSQIIISKNDPFYFSQYINIASYGGISLRQYQKDIITRLNRNRYTIHNCSKQMGMTTVMSLHLIDYLINNINKTVVVFSRNSVVSSKLRNRIIQELYCKIPYHLQVGIVSITNSRVVFDNGCKIFFKHGTVDSVDINGLDYLIIDGLSLFLKREKGKIVTNLIPSLMASAKICIISNPAPSKDDYHTLYHSKGGIYKAFEKWDYPWYIIPERNQDWVKQQIAHMGYHMFLTEYCCMFPGTTEYDREIRVQSLFDDLDK